MPEHATTTDTAEARRLADELGYPVVIDGAVCRTKAEALAAIERADGEILVERPA